MFWIGLLVGFLIGAGIGLFVVTRLASCIPTFRW